MCLNKNANEPGSIDGIRPITIVGVIIKIIEFSILQELKQVELNMLRLD
jgi:hypothetical protein